jgi:hypothetical protein
MYKVNCIVCNKEFKTFHPNYLCCSAECGKTNKMNKKYLRLSGDWVLYFNHLLSKKDTDVTGKDLVELLKKQKGKCALTGETLTCKKVKGEYIKTNASIDRIIAGEGYNIENIQLVCRAVNSFRHDLTISQFINWCKKVANYASKEKKL